MFLSEVGVLIFLLKDFCELFYFLISVTHYRGRVVGLTDTLPHYIQSSNCFYVNFIEVGVFIHLSKFSWLQRRVRTFVVRNVISSSPILLSNFYQYGLPCT